MNPTNQRNPLMVLALLISIATPKHLKAFDAAIYMLYKYTKLRQATVKVFLLFCQLAAFGLFIWGYRVFVEFVNSLISLVAN